MKDAKEKFINLFRFVRDCVILPNVSQYDRRRPQKD